MSKPVMPKRTGKTHLVPGGMHSPSSGLSPPPPITALLRPQGESDTGLREGTGDAYCYTDTEEAFHF